ncbi:hypothetical protein [Nocardia brasiliensis]|uniref:hypothetical protein n=1 Tax=Nocardia brasiliensis TaxID=37326 RepID=UPI00245832EE|nr:hypothetical protein [Nocardia brasiliensis]
MSGDTAVPEPVIEAELVDDGAAVPALYLVTDGEWAHRRILAAFEDRADARGWAILYNAHVPWSLDEDKAVAADNPVPFMPRGGKLPRIPYYDPDGEC